MEAAPSFGDEAFSTAMPLCELQPQGRSGKFWSVPSTDNGDRVLRRASKSTCPENRLRNLSPERLRRHSLRAGGESAGLMQLHPKLRERARFVQLAPGAFRKLSS